MSGCLANSALKGGVNGNLSVSSAPKSILPFYVITPAFKPEQSVRLSNPNPGSGIYALTPPSMVEVRNLILYILALTPPFKAEVGNLKSSIRPLTPPFKAEVGNLKSSIHTLEAVSKAHPWSFTPKSPISGLLIYRFLLSPPWGVWG